MKHFALSTLAVLAGTLAFQSAFGRDRGGPIGGYDVYQKRDSTPTYQGPRLGSGSDSYQGYDSSPMMVQPSQKNLRQVGFCSFINASFGRVLETKLAPAAVAVAKLAGVEVPDLAIFVTLHDDGTSEQVFYSLTNRKFYVANGFQVPVASELAVPGTLSQTQPDLQVFDTDEGEKIRIMGLLDAEKIIATRSVPNKGSLDLTQFGCRPGSRGPWQVLRIKSPVQSPVQQPAQEEQQEEGPKFNILLELLRQGV
jgi:hypothetical protein